MSKGLEILHILLAANNGNASMSQLAEAIDMAILAERILTLQRVKNLTVLHAKVSLEKRDEHDDDREEAAYHIGNHDAAKTLATMIDAMMDDAKNQGELPLPESDRETKPAPRFVVKPPT